jgi:hypothetical protein
VAAEVGTRRALAIPRSLCSHHPSGPEKCRLEAHCRMCQRHSSVRPLTQHHLVPLEWWRRIPLRDRHLRNANANIVPLCRACHDDVEVWDESVRLPARSMLRATLSQQEIAFVIACVGRAWLDRCYPSRWLSS